MRKNDSTLMSVYNKIAIVGASTGGRLVGTLVMYSLLARAFGPAQFGEFGYWYSIGIMLAALSDYGFGQQILTTFSAADNTKIRSDAVRLLQGKMLLVMLLYLAGITFAVIDADAADFIWILLLLGACAASTFFDFFGWMLKARGAFSADSKRTLILALFGNTTAGFVGLITKDLILACSSLFLIRLVMLVSQYRVAARLTEIHWRDALATRFTGVLDTLKGGRTFAADSAAVQGFSNIDIILVKNILDDHAAGIYLAGSRLVQAALAGIPVLASVFIPQMVRAFKGNKFYSVPRSLVALCVIAGVGAAVVFVVGKDSLPEIMFGAEFRELDALMVVFGMAVAVRYLAAVPGTVLSVNRLQIARAWVHFSGFLVFIAVIAVVQFGLHEMTLDTRFFVIGFLLLGVFQLLGFCLIWRNDRRRRANHE
jgi:O-antigen/teichoic acid export membrane protein